MRFVDQGRGERSGSHTESSLVANDVTTVTLMVEKLFGARGITGCMCAYVFLGVLNGGLHERFGRCVYQPGSQDVEKNWKVHSSAE